MIDKRTYSLRDGTLSALHFGDTSEPVRFIFLHANGFNAQSYRVVMQALGVHSIVFDMRGHGESRTLPQPKDMPNWNIFRDDCVEFFDRHLGDLTDAPVVLGGHSFGAVTAILVAPFLQDRINGYIGFDPVSVPMVFRLICNLPSARAFMMKNVPIARNAGRRKSEFESPETAFQRWQGRGAFKGMKDDVLWDYINGGLSERLDGSWELSCDPHWEQMIFVGQQHNLFKAARSLPDNSSIIYAGGKQPVSTRGSRRAVQKAQPNINVEYKPELSHLFPLIKPEFTAQVLRSHIERAKVV